MRTSALLLLAQLTVFACNNEFGEKAEEHDRLIGEPTTGNVEQRYVSNAKIEVTTESEPAAPSVIEQSPVSEVVTPLKNGRTPVNPRLSGGGKNAHGLYKLCGNNELDAKENCDDGNSRDSDGCSRKCLIEKGFPVCQWFCDLPMCNPLLCSPVCEPPQCHTHCDELRQPENCICDVKCEKPECEISCENECKAGECPTCTTTCKPVVCVVHCQKLEPTGPECLPPEPNCNASCGEAPCSCKCNYPDCTPNCQLKCDDIPLDN